MHEVLPGESLAAIAKHYKTSPRAIRRLNRMRSSRLRAGRKLKIKTSYPCRTRVKARYTVRRGDSLSRIARKFKMSRSLLRRLNPKLRRRSRLRAGAKVWVVRHGPRPRAKGGMYRLTSGPGYVVRNPRRAWGTFLSITRLMEVCSSHARAFPDAAPIRVDDISRKGGGYLSPHRSHRRGRDVDIRYPLTVSTTHYVAASPKTLDIKRTWDLLRRFLQTKDVVYIFVSYRLQRALYKYAKGRGLSREQLREYFQYPRGPRSKVGIIRHEPGHRTHMHVRFVREKKPPQHNS